jgi:SAM-dependent methyltransferase
MSERALSAVLDEDPEWTAFLCNVCGTSNYLPRRRLVREDGSCSKCQCYGRLRSMMYAVTSRFSPDEAVLARMLPRKEIRGLGCSDWGYTGYLAEKFDYVNTFYDHDPRLDLCSVDWSCWAPGSFDFITCTDVLEHVEPPVGRTLENMYRLLKPGGVAILTAPTTLEPATCEHFPDLYDWRIATEGEKRVLLNRRRNGADERFDDLCFHGGEGLTLEFRRFSRQGLIDGVQQAGLRAATIHETSVEAHAIPLGINNFVLVAQKPDHDGGGPGTAGVVRVAAKENSEALGVKSEANGKLAKRAPEGPALTIPLYYDDVVRRVAMPRYYHALEEILSAGDQQYARLLRDLSPLTDSLFRISLKRPWDNHEPYFEDASYFSHLDAVALYLLVAHYRPQQIIEIGSGTSTKYMRRAVKDGGLATRIVSIDPHPRAEIDAICDRIVRKNVLDVPVDFFRSLGPNDFLFVDGSHLVFAGTDAPYIFFEILPILAPGVIIHFHDIFLPEDYPTSRQWQDMYYNEQYCLAAFLSHNSDYSVLLPNHYLGKFRPQLVAENLDLSKAPQTDKVCFRSGSSFWLQKRGSTA